MKTNRKKRSGFTIIELMIVLVIVAILLALAYPSYIDYVRKARRGEAQQLLLNWSINQEIWRSNHTAYAPINDDPLVGMPEPTHVYYTFDFSVDPTPTAYTLRANGRNDQVNDTSRGGTPGDCATLTLDQSGVKLVDTCWN
jgi:type IV pilus assembly protein PilE